MGLTLWLVPPAEEIALIQSIMPNRKDSFLSGRRSLAASSYPHFIPHVTLASVPTGSQLPAGLLTRLRTRCGPIRVKFQLLTVSDHYFRSVIISVLPTSDLQALHTEIKEGLSEFSPASPMFPHMSLSYIADEDADERARTAQMLRDRGVVLGNEDQTISLQCGRARLSGFDAMEIWIVDCEGAVEGWSVQDKVLLRT